MVAKVLFFPVGNGDMTLIVFESGRKLLIDMKIRAAADDPDDDTPDVAAELRDLLTRDAEGRLYIDALLISHPDQDHCTRPAERTFISGRRQIGRRPPTRSSSANCGRRRWCSGAHQPNTSFAKTQRPSTAKRAAVLQRFRRHPGRCDGDRILILGEDEDGKTDDLAPSW